MAAHRKTIEQSAAGSMKAKIRKRNKAKKSERPEKGNRQRQTKRPVGYNFCVVCDLSFMASKSTSTLTSGYPLLDSSRHVRTNYCVPSSSPGFLCSDRFRHETCRPLFRRLTLSPLVPGYSHSLVGVRTESSEVVQETPPHSPCSPSILRTSRTSVVSCPLCATQIPRTGSDY